MLSVLRTRDFRLLWLGQSVSVLGDALVLVAVGLFVTDLTGDPGDVGLVLAAYSLPLVAFVLLGGVLADRLPRARLMVASDVARGVLHGVLALLIVTDAVQVWHMVVIGVLFGTAEAFFRPAYAGLVPQTVPEDQVQQAQALSGAAEQVAEVASPAAATALVLWVGGAAAFALDAATFAVSAVLLLRVRARQRGDGPATGTLAADLRDGWRAVRDRTWVWVPVLTFSVALLLAFAPFSVLGPALAGQAYGTTAVYGWAMAAFGLGTLCGALAGGRWRPEQPIRTGLLVTLPWPTCLGALALGPPQTVLYLLLAAAGGGFGLLSVWWETALAERIPPHLLSRVSAWDWLGSLALLPLGYLLAGPLAELLGAGTVLLGGGLLGTAALALALIPASVRTLPTHPDPRAAAPGAAVRPLQDA